MTTIYINNFKQILQNYLWTHSDYSITFNLTFLNVSKFYILLMFLFGLLCFNSIKNSKLLALFTKANQNKNDSSGAGTSD